MTISRKLLHAPLQSFRPIERLPRWARNRIASLEREVADLAEQLRGHVTREGLPRHNAHVEEPGDMLNYVPTPHRVVRFYLSDDSHDYVDIYSDSTGSRDSKRHLIVRTGYGRATITPAASNSFYVEGNRS